ncbi:undecaprenyldiphospho-muramoylpentapeptide beta-N-acetylglucosaminyltransferase [Gallaecimonas sp. GXIMD4217]|uniref:undecaprenyldiphospho-muramoylpentapeptide beta-N-acetylglucosaminyltransferase n=1 Tax=Gallaecimonas sp. GXIMD4217 TaxID=3131927 RepID=UPI00311ADB04
MSKNKTLMVMAGGTGGHIFPALAVAQLLQAEGWTIHWLGTPSRMEAELVPRYEIPLHFIDIQGVRGNGLKRLLVTPFKLAKAIWQARRVFKETRPDVVLGMGGFAAGPGGVAARLMGLPLVIHEQNASAGMTNRLLARLASRVLQAFPGAFAGAQVVGNPIRRSLAEVEKAAHQGPCRVLITGGSLGAQVFNQVLPQAFAQAGAELEIWHQTGKGREAEVEAAYHRLGLAPRVSEFIHDMDQALAWADLVICRAGALTVSELAAVGLPAILVPLPHAVDDHQTRNARYLSDKGAALLLPQDGFTADRVASLLDELNEDPDRLVEMARAARQQARPDATEAVAQILRDLAGHKRKRTAV